MKRLAYAWVLILLTMSAAAAQGAATFPGGDFQPPTIHYTSAIEGVEALSGVVSEKSDVRTGTTYSLDVSGTLAGHFTAVFDSIGPEPDAVSGNQIVRGTWTLAVYTDGVYQGTLFGEITGGTMSWKNSRAGIFSGDIRAELTLKGGTKELAGRIGDQAYGSFDVAWENNRKGGERSTPALRGRLELAF